MIQTMVEEVPGTTNQEVRNLLLSSILRAGDKTSNQRQNNILEIKLKVSGYK